MSSNSTIKFYKNNYIELRGGFLGEKIKYEIERSFTFNNLFFDEYYENIDFNGKNITQNSIAYSPNLEKFCLTVQENDNPKKAYTILLDDVSFQTYKDTCANQIDKNNIQIPPDSSYQQFYIQDHSINVIRIVQIIWSNEINKFIASLKVHNPYPPYYDSVAIITSYDTITWDLVKVFTELHDTFTFQIPNTGLSITNNKLILVGDIWARDAYYVFININDLLDHNNSIKNWWLPSHKSIEYRTTVPLINGLPTNGSIHHILYIPEIFKYIAFIAKINPGRSYTDSFVGYSFVSDISATNHDWSPPVFFDFMSTIWDAYYDNENHRVFAVGDFGIKPVRDLEHNYDTIPSYTNPKTGSRGVLVSGIPNTDNIIWDISQSKSIIKNYADSTEMGLVYSIKKVYNSIYILAGRTEIIYNNNNNPIINPMYAILSISAEDFSYQLVKHSFAMDSYISVALTLENQRAIILANNFIDTFHINLDFQYDSYNLKEVQDRIYLTRNIDLNHKIIGITQYNLNNNITKKDNKIYFHKPKQNIINKGFDNSNNIFYSTIIDLPINSYLFNSNEISNNSTAILNYKLYELTKRNTSIPQLNLGNISNGLLKHFKNFNTIDDIQYKKNSYFSLDKFIGSDNSNIIQNVTYYRPTSISFDLHSFHDQLKDIYEFNLNENLTFSPDISSSLINGIAYSPEFNIYVILINYQTSAEESSASYCIIDTSNIYRINHESLFINPLPYNISFGNSIIWSSKFSKFIIKGTSHLSENRLDRITIASSTYIDISNYVIHWNIDNELLEDNLTMDVIHYGSGESWNQLNIDNCNNYLIMTGEILNEGGWYNIGNITKESVIFNNVQGHKVEGFNYISNMIFISSINKYFILGIDDTRIPNQQSNNPTHYNNAKWAYGTLHYNHTFIPDSSGILHNIINRAYDCIYIEKYNRIYGLGDYKDFTTPDKGVLLKWNVNINSSDISFDMSYIFTDTNSQFRLNQISDNLIVTCGKTNIENTNKFIGSYNKIYLENNGDICNNLIISGHLPVDQESIFLNFAYNNDINQSSIIFAGGSSTIRGAIASFYNIEISNTLLSTDICYQSLYLSYAFKQKNDNTDASFYLIENPRDFTLQPNPVNRNVYQLTTDRFSLDYDFLTAEYEIFSEKLKLIPTNYNGIIPFTGNIDLYLKNNQYILHYNNKIIPMQNIDLTYDGDTDELIVKSLNRFFVGEVTGKFKLKFFDKFSEYEFESTELDVKFNIICNPNLCPLPALPDRRQMSYRIGSMGSFRMQFSNNIQNAHKRTAGRRTVFIDQTKQLRVNNNNQNNNKQIVLTDYFYNLNNLKNWNYESIRLILNLKDYNYQIINNQLSSERKNIPNPFLGMNNVSNSMNALFKDADISINPDISHWNVSSITNMVDMFKNSKSITGEFIKTWDVSNVEEMGGMFYNARSFNADLSYWNVEKVNNMNNMFEGTPYFTGEGLQYWDISQTTTMFSIFENSAFNTDISNWNITRTFSLIDSYNYEDIHDMFAGCNSLSESNRNSIITGWTNTLLDNGFTSDIINEALHAAGLSIT